jgi:hypothetical protein
MYINNIYKKDQYRAFNCDTETDKKNLPNACFSRASRRLQALFGSNTGFGS